MLSGYPVSFRAKNNERELKKMQKKRSIKIISIVLILVLICISISYVKSGNKEVLATTREFNTENLQDNEHMHIELDNSEDKVPVPNGYVGSKATGENEIDTGYVIYEGEEEVNDSNVEESQKTRNQYVWIPVPDASKMYGTDENGKRWGKIYNFTTTIGGYYNPDKITGTYPFGWSENNGVMTIDTSDFFFGMEPDILMNNYDIDVQLKNKNLGIKTSHEFLIQLEQEFNFMIDSVIKYGGFYIGRYETGNVNTEKAVVVKGNLSTNQTWYNLYTKSKNLKNNNPNIITGMIWGCQWDRTLIWLIESGNKTKEEICVDSTGWGNYTKAEFEYIDSSGKLVTKEANKYIKIPTGSTDYAKANNIYDLAGNELERTMESYRGKRASRGGNYSSNVYISVDARDDYQPTGSSDASRAMLYIK